MESMKKLRIKSLYIKWIPLFTLIIAIAQIFTFILAVRFVVPEIEAGLSEKLYLKAVFAQNLYDQGYEITDETLAAIGDADIYFQLLDDTSSVPGDYGDEISLRMLRQAKDGEIVASYFHTKDIGMPFCLVAVGDQIAFLAFKLDDNNSALFFNGLRTSVLMGAMIGSLFIVIALIAVISPIKRVTQAAKEVAKGNFNVQLKSKSADEIGQLVENFNRMVRGLQKNEYLKKEFVSSVSHEFKTPLTSIEGYAKLLRSKELAREQFEEYTDIIVKETGRLSNLSSNLLKLSVLDSSEFEPEKNVFYLDEQIRNVVLLLQAQWEEKRIEFDIELEEVFFYANEELLSQVWINLIQNSIKFSPDESIITIKLKSDNAKASVTIADQGVGISAEHRDKIFDRFYKADKSRSIEGAGLGLSIEKRILEVSNGGIIFENKPEGGTAFVVTLPLGVQSVSTPI
jgi:signal transduction histidine kinase